MREDLLVRLSHLQRHNRAMELAAASSCTSALLGHAAQLRGCTGSTGAGSAAASERGSVASSGPAASAGSQASGSSSSGALPGSGSPAAQLCAEMGRACSTASVEVLVGMVVEAQETTDGLPDRPSSKLG